MINFKKDRVYVINLDKRTDRIKSCKSQLDKLNIQFTRFSAICPNIEQIKNDPVWYNSYQGISKRKSAKYNKYLSGSLGCKMSHYYVIKKGVEKELPYMIIFEDDLILYDNAKQILDDFKSIEVDDWDIIYLGGTVIGKRYEKISDYIERVESVIHMLGYIIHQRAYKIVTDSFISKNIECDNILLNLAKNKKIKVYHCNMVKQTWDDSDIISGYISKSKRKNN